MRTSTSKVKALEIKRPILLKILVSSCLFLDHLSNSPTGSPFPILMAHNKIGKVVCKIDQNNEYYFIIYFIHYIIIYNIIYNHLNIFLHQNIQRHYIIFL